MVKALFLTLLFSGFATNTLTPVTYYMCKSGIAVRTLRIEMRGSTCNTIYTKEGIDKPVGKSFKIEICTNVLNKIKANLESGKWECRDITQARVSEVE